MSTTHIRSVLNDVMTNLLRARPERIWCPTCEDYTPHVAELVDHARDDVRFVYAGPECERCGRGLL